jgi:hypothetical protein
MASRAGAHSSKEPARLITAATTRQVTIHASMKAPRRSRSVIVQPAVVGQDALGGCPYSKLRIAEKT